MTTPDRPAEGSCLCGAVRFRIEPPYVAFQYCHCSRCRKASGSAHGANVFVPAAQLAWTAGEDHVRRHELASARMFCTGFCDTCGSRLPWLTRSGKVFIVPAGALDDDPGGRPTRNIHYASRAPWYTSCADLPVFDADPPR